MNLGFKLKYFRMILINVSGQESIFWALIQPQKVLKKIKSKGLNNSFYILRKMATQMPNPTIPLSSFAKSNPGPFTAAPYGAHRFHATLDASRKPSVQMITDSLGNESLFGGVLTSLLFCILLCEDMGRNLKIILTQNPSKISDLEEILHVFDIDTKVEIEYLYRPESTLDPVFISKDDVYVPTSSWTCLQAMRSFPQDKIFYILQEDERLFFPSGHRSYLALQAMNNANISYIVNTESLRKYLITAGFENLEHNSISFEPSFRAIYSKSQVPAKSHESKVKKVFAFYSRPNHDRNMYWTGVNAINEAVKNQILNQGEWEIHFLGINNSIETLDLSFEPIIVEKMDYKAYIRYLKKIDIGMALMASPHPGYPTLDFIAAGAKSITNSWPGKMDFDLFGESIYVAESYENSLIMMIEEAVESIQDSESLENTKEILSPYSDSWKMNFTKSFEFVKERIRNV